MHGKTSNAARLLIHLLGGTALVAGLLTPPVDKQLVWAWAKGKRAVSQTRLEQLLALQEARKCRA